eukprot:852551-Amorphochlora_amoeboformis.AAC.1
MSSNAPAKHTHTNKQSNNTHVYALTHIASQLDHYILTGIEKELARKREGEEGLEQIEENKLGSETSETEKEGKDDK